MVVVKSNGAEAFLTRHAQQISVFLFFGSDPGLVSERANAAIKMIGVDTGDPFQVVRLDGGDIASEPGRLLDETNTFSLFGSTRAIRIELGSSDITTPLEVALQNSRPDWKIIIEAGALKRDSNIRRLCERHRSTVAIECNQDRLSDIERLLDGALLEIRIDDNAKDYFLGSLGSDRLSTRMEIEKLVTYAHGKQSIEIADVELLVADTSNIALDQTINSAFSSNLASLEESWKRLSAGGVDGSTMLSAALREAMALLQYCCANEQGASGFSSPEQRYSRGFGRTPLTSENLRKWSLDRACHAIEVLNTSCADCMSRS